VSYRSLRAEDQPQMLAEIARDWGRTPEDLLNHVFLRMGTRVRAIPLRRMMQDMEWGFFPAMPGPGRLAPRLPGTWRIHEELTAGLRSILVHEPSPVLVLQGKDGVLEQGSEEWTRLGAILEPEGYVLFPFDLGRAGRVPGEAALLVIPAIRRRLDDAELGALRAYEEAGGRMVVYADPRLPESFPRLFERFGVELLDAWFEDRTLEHPRRRGPEDLQSQRFCQGVHAIDAPLEGKVEIFAGPCRPIRVTEARAPRATRTTLLAVSEAARTVPVRFDPATGRPEPEPARAVNVEPSDRSIAIALERATDSGKSRIVLFGGASFLAPAELAQATFYGNRDLLLNTLAWVTERESAIGLLPREEVQTKQVSLARVEKPAFYASVVLLPAIALLLAALLFWSRRS
jgi:hypothetical protein